jgi:DNA-binding NarL/FixJ family response regulator
MTEARAEPAPIRVLFVDDEAHVVDVAATFLERHRDEFVVHTETSAAAGIEYLEREAVDCIVSDYRMPGMNGLDFLDAVRSERPELPFILSTGKGSEEVASEAISAGVTDYLRKGTGTDQYEVLANRIENAVAQRRAEQALADRERRLASQRDELTTLNRINVVIQDIIRGLIEAATREEIAATICERIAASDLYEFAWIADRDASGDLAVQTGAGIDTADIGTITTDGGAGPGEGVQVFEDPVPESWRVGTDDNYQSVAAIPLSYEGMAYGVLAVYATRPDAFSERERAGFGVLGEVAGFAINAAQNMKLLLSDTAVALELRVVDDAAFPVSLTQRLDCQYSLDGVVPSTDGTVLQYVTVEGVESERVLDLAAEFSDIVEHRLVSEHEAGGVFEFATRVSPVNSLIDIGGTVSRLTAEDGEARIVVETAGDTDVRAVVDAFERAHPGSELLSKHTVELPFDNEERFRRSVEERLTEKQQAALRAAYFAGYYDWPRRSTAEEIAESMGVSSPTLHNHLRKAQRKLLLSFLGDSADE